MPDPNPANAVTDVTLHGRAAEVHLLDQLVRDGRGALVLRGAPGVGKTALLRHVVARARGYRVVHVRSSETRPYAALRQLCTELGGVFEQLLPHQARALRAVTEDSDPFLVGVATTVLVSAAAPVLCVVDDVQGLDEPSVRALSFVARRLPERRVVLLFAERAGAGVLADLPELVVPELCRAGARALVESLVAEPVDEDVVDRFVAETRGNPRAIRSAVHALAPAGGFGLADGNPDADSRERVLRLGSASRTLLLAAAADPTGDVALLWRAATRLGIPTVAPDGLLTVGEWVTFTDPAVRGWVYHGATPSERRTVHRALADASTSADRRAWHHARSVAGPDPAAAGGLVAQVSSARQRGGPSAAAAFLRVAAALTADPALRAERVLAAAAAELDAGQPGRALRLLDAMTGPLEPAQRVEAARLRAWLTFTSTRTPAAAEALLRATHQAAAFGPPGQAGLDALGAAVLTGVDFAPGSASPCDGLAAGLMLRGADGFGAAVGPLTAALETARPSWLAGLVAAELWDDQAWHRAVSGAADPGALPDVLTGRALFSIHTGNLTGAAALDDEARTMSAKLGQAPLSHATPLVAAWRGQEFIGPAGHGLARTCVELATAVAGNAVGDHSRALAAAQRVVERDEVATAGWALVELVEAAAGAGRLGVADNALQMLVDRTDRCGTDWALGAQARSRALLAEGPEAGLLFREAIERLARTKIRTLLARTRLGHGEWLRRQGRDDEAAGPLRAAYGEFLRMGATAFADRAQLAIGEPETPATTTPALTPQENRIAALARDGLTNSEIGAALSISPRTVEYHLRKVFAKLRITSRAELHVAFAEHRPGTEDAPR
ncbi:LuxR C-terminal-related transcriptional regulator [Amycolatopsis carbonis]|uniref:LuxR C-terminal-related transcriptional regulator n=1 Tax=Amycolatopsis carbonis TaxID=715471 RepID=A0A9Y2IA04_9PSEU|nr:AAA family ATPase [Amycolatopsis sp. 2-15]WIX76550.1 LuxR C-terminal-related transcriptional regulator [Amycolatopsis sp. 2-15]